MVHCGFSSTGETFQRQSTCCSGRFPELEGSGGNGASDPSALQCTMPGLSTTAANRCGAGSSLIFLGKADYIKHYRKVRGRTEAISQQIDTWIARGINGAL